MTTTPEQEPLAWAILRALAQAHGESGAGMSLPVPPASLAGILSSSRVIVAFRLTCIA